MAQTKYREIVDRVTAEIADLPPGTRVSGEHEIGERFGVGRAAARAALLELQRRMLVRRVQGVGTFTSRRIDYVISPERPPSWSEAVRVAGAVPRTVVTSCEVVALPDEIAAILEREPGTTCYLLRRRSFTDEVPAAWGTEWVPVDVVPDLDVAVQAVGSLDRILREMVPSQPRRAWSRASQEIVDAEVATELGCSPGDFAWLVDSLNHDAPTGRLLCFTQRWMRADAVRVVIESGTASRTE